MVFHGEHPDAYLWEYQHHLERRLGLVLCRQTVCNHLGAMGLSLKKNPVSPNADKPEAVRGLMNTVGSFGRPIRRISSLPMRRLPCRSTRASRPERPASGDARVLCDLVMLDHGNFSTGDDPGIMP